MALVFSPSARFLFTSQIQDAQSSVEAVQAQSADKATEMQARIDALAHTEAEEQQQLRAVEAQLKQAADGSETQALATSALESKVEGLQKETAEQRQRLMAHQAEMTEAMQGRAQEAVLAWQHHGRLVELEQTASEQQQRLRVAQVHADEVLQSSKAEAESLIAELQQASEQQQEELAVARSEIAPARQEAAELTAALRAAEKQQQQEGAERQVGASGPGVGDVTATESTESAQQGESTESAELRRQLAELQLALSAAEERAEVQQDGSAGGGHAVAEADSLASSAVGAADAALVESQLAEIDTLQQQLAQQVELRESEMRALHDAGTQRAEEAKEQLRHSEAALLAAKGELDTATAQAAQVQQQVTRRYERDITILRAVEQDAVAAAEAAADREGIRASARRSMLA